MPQSRSTPRSLTEFCGKHCCDWAQYLWLFVCMYVSLSPPQIPLQKLLFSATLTQNPEKLQLLDLHQPRLFSSTHTFSETPQSQDTFNFPQGLSVSLTSFPKFCNQTHWYSSPLHTFNIWECLMQEYYVSCNQSNKPLIILHFLLRLKFSPALCFTNSREGAHR